MKASNTVPVMIAAVVAAAIMYPREESMIPAIPDANEASVMLNKENTENTRGSARKVAHFGSWPSMER